MTNQALKPVAEYLRMSTEHQQYSLVNQSAAIAGYASAHGFSVVATYADPGKSGLSLKRRQGLRRLLNDVVQEKPGFEAILVYDVSRWGRFQDVDESAHYEFLCKSAGVPVHYCAEQFGSAGDLPSMIMKSLKRTMAAEYSRELSVKVSAGLKRLALLGFKQGGQPGYGLRRMLLSSDGTQKQQLSTGERKSIADDRVTLVPGPESEIAIVREIYRSFIKEKLSIPHIAEKLNDRLVPCYGSMWNYYHVHQILSHPKYAGSIVFGMTSQKLHTRVARIPRDQWTVKEGAFDQIVSQATFDKAQRRLQNLTVNKSDRQLLDDLRTLLKRKRALSVKLIEDCPGLASPSTYRHRFGNLPRAYDLIGYGRREDYRLLNTRHITRIVRDEFLEEIMSAAPPGSSLTQPSGRWRMRIQVPNGDLVSILTCRAKVKLDGSLVWRVNPENRELSRNSRFTLLALFDGENSRIQESYLLVGPGDRNRFQVVSGDEFLKDCIQVPDVTAFWKILWKECTRAAP